MPKLMKPLIVIALAVGVAAGAAVFLSRNAVRTADFFQIPPSRVVELGAQVAF